MKRQRRLTPASAQAASLSGGLGPRLAEHIGTRRTTHLFKSGQALFYEGAPAHALFVVRTGRVKVYRTSRAGDVQVLRLLGAGELIGYRPLLAHEANSASAEAVEDSSICILPADDVRRLLRDDAALATEMLAKLAVELRLSEELMMDLIHRPVRQRVARLLLRLVEDNRAADRPERLESRHMRRQDMARMVGTTPESLSRVLRSLAQSGVLSLTREHLDVRDSRQLARIAGMGHAD
jgi:CRP/FNR family transcriptional regulator